MKQYLTRWTTLTTSLCIHGEWIHITAQSDQVRADLLQVKQVAHSDGTTNRYSVTLFESETVSN